LHFCFLARPASDPETRPLEKLFQLDWEELFVPSTSLVEIVVRGTLMYLALFFLLRVVLKRQSGGVSITDILVIVLIADAAQNGMAGEYTSITEGLLLVGTILAWSFVIDWIAFHVPVFERFLSPPPLKLVENGRLLRRNLRKEYVTEDELMGQIRLKGLRHLNQVQAAFMESDGDISVIAKADVTPQTRTRKRRQRRPPASKNSTKSGPAAGAGPA
jgi:uncharacterized membrane protein YcaP (DUF421 family)